MKRDTSTVNFEPLYEDEEGELSSSMGCLIFLGVVLLVIAFIVGFIARFFNNKIF